MKTYILLTAATLSLDTFAVGIAYGIKKINFTPGGMFAFILTGFLTSLFSAVFGRVLALIAPGKLIGGLILTATGAAMLLQQFDLGNIPLLRLIAAPDLTDLNKNRKIELKEAFVLAAALSVDSSAACSGSIAGGCGLLLPFFIFVFQPLFLHAGLAVGRRFSPGGSERICGITAGILLVALGVGSLI